RLVGRIDLVAERGGEAFIECHRDVLRLGSLHQIAKEACETEGRVRGMAVAVRHVRRHRVIGAENVNRRVDEINHARIVYEMEMGTFLISPSCDSRNQECLHYATWPMPPTV